MDWSRKKRYSNGKDHTNDIWRIKCAAIQNAVNQHDWMHRASCFKNNPNICRYGIPQTPMEETKVNPKCDDESDTNETSETVERNFRIAQLNILIRKRAPFIFMTIKCNTLLLLLLFTLTIECNSFLQQRCKFAYLYCLTLKEPFKDPTPFTS